MSERPVLGRSGRPPAPIAHPDLDGLDEADQHPVEAISGLIDWLEAVLVAGSNVTITEGNGTLVIASSGGGGGDFQTVGPFDLLEGGGTLTGVPRHVAVSGSEGDLPGPVSVTMPSAPADPDGAWTVSYGAFDDASLDELDVVGALNLSVIPRGYTAVLTPVPGVGWFCDGLFPTATVPTGGGAVDSVNGQTGAVVLDAGDVGADPAGTAAGLVDDLSGVSNQATARTNLGLGTAATAATGDFAAASHTHTGSQVTVDASGFNGNLTTSDDTVQEVAQKLDDLVIPAAGIADPGGANDDFLQRKSGAWTNRTIAQVQDDLGVLHKVATPVGFWTGAVSGTTLEVNQTDLYLSAGGRGSASVMWLAGGTYDRIAVAVSSAGTATIRLGLWAADRATGLPGALVLDAGTVSMAGSAGLREITISLTIPSGWYWASMSADAYTSTFNVWGMGNTASSPVHGMPLDVADIRLRHRNSVASAGFNTTGLPTPFPTIGNYNAAAPKVVLRRSA